MAVRDVLNRAARLIFALALVIALAPGGWASAQDDEPTDPVMLDPSLGVETVVDGLTTPIGLAFLDEDEMFVIEKNSGQVLHIDSAGDQSTVLDLAVNFSSERGLLGITLDPAFDDNGYVYLYWTCSAEAPPEPHHFPVVAECEDEPETGDDTDDLHAVPLLGNRVDRFVWDGSELTWDVNLIKLRAFQHDGAPLPRNQGDEEQPARGNHNGGVITFGEDGKLYIVVGDVGRRGWLQNLPFGPRTSETSDEEMDALLAELPQLADDDDSGEGEGGNGDDDRGGRRPVRSPSLLVVPDDQFGGPYPDDAHYTGVVIRLNNDGSIPDDNPFYRLGGAVGGEVGENLQKTFAYGIRNSFGMAVDPESGRLWITENGEDAYDELNLVEPGFNSGWIQVMGPLANVDTYKEIETTSLNNEDFPNLQQFRWGPENIADSPGEARSKLFRLPGSRYSDPEFSWEFVTAPAALGFVEGDGLGDDYDGDLFMGFSIPFPVGGALFRFNLNDNRTEVSDPGQRVADNGTFYSLVESEQYLIGANFGVVTDIETGPDGNLYVVSLSNAAVYQISQQSDVEVVHLRAELQGENEVPGPGDEDGEGIAHVFIDPEAATVCYSIVVSNITLPATGAHIHQGGADVAGPVVVPFDNPDETGSSAGCVLDVDADLVEDIVDNPAGYYVNVHNADFPGGAIRDQLSVVND